MPIFPVSCALCGAPVQDESQAQAELWPAWMLKFRAVYSPGRLLTEAHLSGIGRRELFRDVVSPGTMADGQPVSDDGFFQIWLMRTAFGPPDPSNRKPMRDRVDIQALLDIFRSFPVQDGLISFGQDYSGDSQYVRFPGTFPVGEELGFRLGRTPEHQKCDPLEITELRHFFQGQCQDGHVGDDNMATYGSHAVSTTDSFSQLPEEVLQYVFEHLPSSDVLHLRQSSRACANVPLSQSFFMSRSLPGQEFDAVFEARLHAMSLKGRWQSLYRLVKSIQQGDPFANRKRVWNLAHSLWNILDQVCSTNFGGDEERLESLRWVAAITAIRRSMFSFSDGTRDLYYRTINIPTRTTRVYASLVDLYGRRYVSAIRAEGTDGDHAVLGYRHSDEVLISGGAGGIAGFHLAQDERGFRSLAVLFTSGPLSEWVGQHDGVPVRRLALPTTPSDNSIRHLKCGFDALKIVALSISDAGSANEAPKGMQSILDTSRFFPFLPGPCLSFLGMDGTGLWHFRPEMPITLAMFDASPRDLKTISSIAVRIGTGDFWDLEVRYPPGITPVRLGVEGVTDGQVSSFLIDYANGEFIRGIESFYELQDTFLGFKVHTNTGRVGEFSLGPLDEMPKDIIHVESLFPKDGTIVGFCSRVSHRWGLHDLGAVYRTDDYHGEV